MTTGRVVAVFGSSAIRPDSPEWADAELVGRRLATHGLAVITGGYGGVMEAVSKGAAAEGGRVLGVTAPTLFPGRAGANPHVAELIEATALAERIGVMMSFAEAAIALPGSIGTATELLMAWNTNHILRRNGDDLVPTVAVGRAWRSLARTLIDEAGAGRDDIHFADTVDEALEWTIVQIDKRTTQVRTP